MSSDALQLKMVWVPSHIRIKGNEIADSIAKQAIHHPITWKVILTVNESSKLITSAASFLRIINTCITTTNIYVLSFEGHCIPHHLIHPNRKIANSIFHLRTGHAMTRSCQALYHLTGSKSCPFYRYVNIDKTIDHIFSECPHFTTERNILIRKINSLGLKTSTPLVLGFIHVSKDKEIKILEAVGVFGSSTKIFNWL